MVWMKLFTINSAKNAYMEISTLSFPPTGSGILVFPLMLFHKSQ